MPKVMDLDVHRIKDILIREKPYLTDKYHISSIGIFGSVIRNEPHKRSDVDILVDFDETISAFQFIDLKDELSDKLGAKVDLVSQKALKPRIGKRILAEVQYV